jgi:hypothetical protein
MNGDQAAQKAEAVRAQISARSPALLECLDECKRVFGARLLAIDCGPVQRGDARSHSFGTRLVPYRTPAEQEAEWKREAEAIEARAGAYKGAGFKRATRSR